MKRNRSRMRAPHPDAPLQLEGHGRAMSRRELLGRGLRTGGAAVALHGLGGLMFAPRRSVAALSPDLAAVRDACGIAVQGAGRIPFICFDLAGGASMAGSNVLVGRQGGQEDFLTTDGYARQGLPGDMVPPAPNAATATGQHLDRSLGLAFHSDSAFLRGILDRVSAGTAAATNGAVIPARSENDTGNNPHNPMYAIQRAGADGSLLTLIGSRNSDSGGNSMAPMELMDPEFRPTKVDRPEDVTALVDTGDLTAILDQADAVNVLESIYRLSAAKLENVSTGLADDAERKEQVRCAYAKSADLADRFGDPAALDPSLDPDIVGPAGIFTSEEFQSDREFRKTASVMKLVINGFAGAGTIAMGGYDYHTGNRSTGETRDLRAGRCMGACLEYAARVGVPLMLYVFSDGSLSSNGMIDDSPEGRGKLAWTSDNQSTAANFFMVYNPAGRPVLLGGTPEEQARHQQLGYMRPEGSVESASSPMAANVHQLVQAVAMNYLALHGETGRFPELFPGHGLGNAGLLDRLTAFQPIVSGTIG